MGSPLDPENRIGFMVSQAHFEKVRSYLEQAGVEKLRVVFGGHTEGEIFVEPTVFDGGRRHPDLRCGQFGLECRFWPVCQACHV
ncbi:aldehyde dehydrogenase family protein [Pseudomonas sp. BIC9C]|uniref:aldehyde dehydrogenase family protein n=1 Tax=Pseudomonas sp. BIC9C TaxID=3078458 RepID=UPI003A522867